MTTREFLSRLRQQDIRVWAEADRLRCNAPFGALSPELQAELKARKPEILAFLRAMAAPRSSLVPIQPAGTRRPFFGVPGHNGDVFCYVRLARHLGTDQPFYALEPPGVDGRQTPLASVEELAAHFVRDIRAFQTEGPYPVGGYCLGGVVAFEVALQLRAQGHEVALLALFESPCPTAMRLINRVRIPARYHWRRVAGHVRALAREDVRGQLRYLAGKARTLRERMWERGRGTNATPDDPRTRVSDVNAAAAGKYRPGTYPGRISLFLANEESRKLCLGRQLDWGAFATGGLEVDVGPDGCTSDVMLREPHVEFFARALRRRLDPVEAEYGALRPTRVFHD